jgi:NAD(P)-dependent dehydrogenase (short-subunit alcohol dehydrogenase family)
MAGRLEGKVAVVTGGSSGIGEATATLFVQQGARVVVGDRRPPGPGLAGLGEALAYQATDVTREADLAALFDAARRTFGGLDILVNNAGAEGTTSRIADMDPAAWDAAFALLVRAPMLGIKLAAPLMRARGGGSIVNLSSAAGLRSGLTSSAAYGTAKSAVLKLTHAAALELAADNIRVNAILPGAIATPLFAESMKLDAETARRVLPEVEAIYAGGQPLRRTGRPLHVAQAALFLASDEAAFVTGLEMIVDGGLTLNPAKWSGARRKMVELGERIGREAPASEQGPADRQAGA